VLGVLEGTVYRTVKRYGRLVGKPELKPHDLRHAFATRLLENGVNIRYVQELLGHSSVATTQIYEQVAGNHLEDAINTLNKEPNGKKPTSETRKRTPGLHWLVCENCGAEIEVETGIRVMYCCAQKMKEV